MGIEVTEESIHNLRKMASQITGVLEEMWEQTEKTRAMADEHWDELGPHQVPLCEALENVHMNIKRASDSAEVIAKRLTEIAETCQKIIEECGR